MLNYNIVTTNIRNILKNYIIENKLKALILGVSGGIDSTLCAALAKPVCKELNIPLIGRSLPTNTNKQCEILRAYDVGKTFCDDFKEVDIGYITKQISEFIDIDVQFTDDVPGKIRKGNIKARMRMVYLYNLAHANSGMVLSTDNLTERMLGFFTIHGDECDFGMIQNLWKTEVYELAKYLITISENENEKNCLLEGINAVPTDGLGITNSDLEAFGVDSYEKIDRILRDYIVTGYVGGAADLNNPIVKRHIATGFKRNLPYNIERTSFLI
jgi:NAD+ synthetase